MFINEYSDILLANDVLFSLLSHSCRTDTEEVLRFMLAVMG